MRLSLALLLIGTRGEMLPRMAEAPVVRRTRPHKSIEARSEATASGVEDARVDAMDKADAHSADSFLENAVGDNDEDEEGRRHLKTVEDDTNSSEGSTSAAAKLINVSSDTCIQSN